MVKRKRKTLPLRRYIDFELYDEELDESKKDDFILNKLVNKYGVALEGLTKLQKVLLIMMIANRRCLKETVKELGYNHMDVNIHELMGEIDSQLDLEEQEQLMEALINYVRYG